MSVNCNLDHGFIRLDGNNHASYFFSAANSRDWRRSLEFYRAVSIVGYCKKSLLLWSLPVLRRRASLSCREVGELLGRELSLTESPMLDEQCSALISPTRDKAIIHRHGLGYEKFAVGDSLPGVTRELDVYRLLSKKMPQTFAFSPLGAADAGLQQTRFLMQYADGQFDDRIPRPASLVTPLVDFFSCGGTQTQAWADRWQTLIITGGDEVAGRVMPQDQRGTTPVGLVHRDFKPWNVKYGSKPLFFDFEMASFTGCPLEDLLNYTVDPMLRTTSPAAVGRVLYGNAMTELAEQYMEKSGFNTEEINRCRRWYLLERFTFWQQKGQAGLARKYLNLYDLHS